MRPLLAALLAAAAVLSGCTGAPDDPGVQSTASPMATATTVDPAPTTAAPSSRPTLWLCHPDEADVCDRPVPTVVVRDAAVRSTTTRPALDPLLDCFYVYPTVSTSPRTNAPLRITPELEYVVRAQAVRFARACRLFAPVYRQVTLRGLRTSFGDPSARERAHRDVVAAWRQYLAQDNDGRPFVLIGHSQGAFELTRLLQEQIEPDADVRARLVSALLLGGSVTVPVGQDVGGTFQRTPACRSTEQTGCVVAYNTFAQQPPDPSLFGRTLATGQQVLCVNPAAPGGGAAALDPVLPRPAPAPARMNGLAVFPDSVVGECRTGGGASWFQVRRPPGSALPARALQVDAPPFWGLHRLDVSIALDDLVGLVERQGRAWTAQASG